MITNGVPLDRIEDQEQTAAPAARPQIEDDEVLAIAVVLETLLDLPTEESRIRVLHYLIRRLGYRTHELA